jgi:hypothetical protein
MLNCNFAEKIKFCSSTGKEHWLTSKTHLNMVNLMLLAKPFPFLIFIVSSDFWL